MRLISSLCRASAVLLLAGTAIAQSGQQGMPQRPMGNAGAAGAGAQAQGFPPIDASNFNASEPKPETVDAFMKQMLGFDSDRIWQVDAVRKTLAPGFVSVTVLMAQKTNPSQVVPVQFLITPDQKWAIQGGALIPFGAHPFVEMRRILEERATGPAKGPADKKFMFVEFSDMECPHCKAAQPDMERLMKDYPNARFVYESFPLPKSLHPWAEQASLYGACVDMAKGSDAFFTYVNAVFDAQDHITADNATEMLKAAVTKAGADPAAVATCSTTDKAKAQIDAVKKLADEVDVTSTPTLFVNGRRLPLGPNLTYEVLRRIVDYQAQLDGITVQPEMSGLPK